MADFERKLEMLAERGTRVGPEEMIERVEAQLAEDPLVVVTKQRKGRGMSIQTDERQDQNRGGSRPGLIWAAAAFVVIVGFGVLYLALSDDGGSDVVQPAPPAPTIPATTVPSEMATDLGVINEFQIAWHDGDVERAFELLGADPAESPGSADWSRYEGLVNAEVEAECEPSEGEPHLYDCVVSYETDLHRAVDAVPDTILWTARVFDGATIEVISVESEDAIRDSWHAWQNETLRTTDSPCGLGPMNPDCAEYQHEHIDEWAAWYLANN